MIPFAACGTASGLMKGARRGKAANIDMPRFIVSTETVHSVATAFTNC
jgi:hypothetical protein